MLFDFANKFRNKLPLPIRSCRIKQREIAKRFLVFPSLLIESVGSLLHHIGSHCFILLGSRGMTLMEARLLTVVIPTPMLLVRLYGAGNELGNVRYIIERSSSCVASEWLAFTW